MALEEIEHCQVVLNINVLKTTPSPTKSVRIAQSGERGAELYLPCSFQSRVLRSDFLTLNLLLVAARALEWRRQTF